jgi:hypothetical protein
MPFCEDCAKYWAPSAMNEDGSCPTCGRVVEPPRRPPPVTAKSVNVKQLAAGDSPDDAEAPWHFKLLMVMLVLYLGWRVVDLFI